jgi:uncharacterized repeat protein (TIGR02543 family)
MMNRKELYAAAALLLLFSACEMLGPKSGAEDEKAAVRIAIEASGAQGRTALPAVELENVTAWKLWGGKSSEPETLLKDFSGAGTTLYLETGAWDFTLKGYKDDALILQGTITGQTITLAGPNVLSFTVAPLMEGNGTFKITINLPDGHGITKAEVFTRNESAIDELAPVDDAIVFEDDYAAGDYYFSIRLYKDDDLYGVVSEIAQVRGNLRSEKIYTLTAEDLNLTYTVTYHLNEGEFDSEAENPGYYRSAGANFTLPVPTRAGYIFGGWYDDEECNGGAVTVIPQGSAGDKEFYAQWTVITYTISYALNGGTNGSNPAAYTIETPDITLAGGARDYYSFAGWHDNPELTGYAVTTISAGSTGNKTFYAQWTAIPYTITYHLNDGTNNPANPASYTVESPAIILAEPSRADHTFEGWHSDADFANPATEISAGSTGDKTFYAQWAYLYTVTFDDDGGTTAANPPSKTVAEPAATIDSLPEPPAKTGYNFGGWFTQQNGGGSPFTATTTVTGSITVYAKWDSYSYTVTFNNAGGTTAADPATKTVTSPATTVGSLPVPPAKAGYNFGGWFTQQNGGGSPFTETTTVSGAITVYALWPETAQISLTPDAGDGTFEGGNFTLSKGGNGGNPDNRIITLDGAGYTNPLWLVDGSPKGTGESITIRAADYNLGVHHLSLLVRKNGVAWSKDIAFTVIN